MSQDTFDKTAAKLFRVLQRTMSSSATMTQRKERAIKRLRFALQEQYDDGRESFLDQRGGR